MDSLVQHKRSAWSGGEFHRCQNI